MPTKGPERQEVINKGQSAKLEWTTKQTTEWKPDADRTFLYDGSIYEHQQSWESWRPNSQDQQATWRRADETPYQYKNYEADMGSGSDRSVKSDKVSIPKQERLVIR